MVARHFDPLLSYFEDPDRISYICKSALQHLRSISNAGEMLHMPDNAFSSNHGRLIPHRYNNAFHSCQGGMRLYLPTMHGAVCPLARLQYVLILILPYIYKLA